MEIINETRDEFFNIYKTRESSFVAAYKWQLPTSHASSSFYLEALHFISI